MALRRHDRPRAVVLGLESDDPAAQTIRGLFPHTDLAEDMLAVRQTDYDVVFVFGEPPDDLHPTSHIFWVGDDTSHEMSLAGFVSRIQPGVNHFSAKLSSFPGGRSIEFDVPSEALSIAPQSLLETLEPPHREYLQMALAHQPPDKVFKQTRLLTEKGGGVGIIGLVAERMDNHRQVWALPNCVRDHLAEWLDVAVQQWQNRDKTAFPRLDWAAQEDWMDSDELDAAARLRQHDAEAEATMARLSRERARLVDAQATARNAADQGLRQLLTTNSDALVDAVSSTLEDLGFTVVDADSLERARKFEDLQVFDGDWVCLVEVKGYEKRNAKTADLVQLAGAVSHYQEDHPAPSAQWYIINQSYATPPSLRLNPFKSDPDTVEQFANNHGLVIDTRELFRLVTRVHQEELSRDEARGLLRKTRGVFTAQD